MIQRLGEIDLTGVRTLLCDADGCLFPSEVPAFEASVEVTNRLLAELGSKRRLGARELRLATTGKNFRATAAALAAEERLPLGDAELETWVVTEKDEVTAHLRETLRPDRSVIYALAGLSSQYRLAVVTSSAMSRVEACLEATALDGLFSPEVCFSAEDSLPEPRSKPDPAIYVHAGERLGSSPGEAIAIEDSAPGVESAVRAGYRVIGNVGFVEHDERSARIEELAGAGAAGVVLSWGELLGLLTSPEGAGTGRSGEGR